jgi:hypothetical protein
MNSVCFSQFLKPAKLILSAVALIILSACAHENPAVIKKGPHTQKTSEWSSQLGTELPPAVASDSAAPTAPAVPATPEISATNSAQAPVLGVILGPSGFKSFFAVGFLQELAKSKLPIKAVAGIELGALVAALYAHHAQAYEAEWQMMKLKESEFAKKSMWSSGLDPQDVTVLEPLLNGVFGQENFESTKLKFLCPSELVRQNNRVQMQESGRLSEGLKKCIAHAPFYNDYVGFQAAPAALPQLIEALQKQGVTHVVYLDLQDGKPSPVPVFKDLHFPSSYEFMNDFSHRRELLLKGRDFGKNTVEEIQHELGL